MRVVAGGTVGNRSSFFYLMQIISRLCMIVKAKARNYLALHYSHGRITHLK